MPKSFVVETIKRNQIVDALAKGKRLDGRGVNEYRKLEIKTHVIQKANGSAMVTLGDTQVLAGVKIDKGVPFPDTPDKGLLIVGAEVLPMAASYLEAGPPDESAIELARVVDRGVRESEMIDVSSLVIKEGKWVYSVFVDVNILNVDGNLFDATSYAVVAALLTAKMPRFVLDGDTVKDTGERLPLPVRKVPVSVTMATINGTLVLDPTEEEEAVMDARITLDTEDEGHICAGQKGEPGSFTPEQVLTAAEWSIAKGREIRQKIKEATAGG
ncbi:MAG: exosome complex protein Rrp42 [Nitrososphaerota archaeon]|nr:exosome complex protein Rrp42 [Nitrososphaerota archaeon]MDG6966628.1 exosome complex protein Rrp42 [Nitrososphaerota archaeon]MDG6978513.1 exosome complex protein Rrp42 [Nitrososphaerota archaeon]MDG7005965.1 exosome complex protein Rrp42 [Nitrososphaerota archaeon]MDG7022027.1 exosome complex protein Rrp42 [Nitrososphaerota archaeon]